MQEYGPVCLIVLSKIDVLDEHCTNNDLSISKELEKATDHLAEMFQEVNRKNPKPPHIQAMDLTSGKFFQRILKRIDVALEDEVGDMPLKQFKEQKKRNYMKAPLNQGGRRGSQQLPGSDAVTFTTERASFH